MWLSQIDLRFFYDCSWLSVCFLPNGFILELVTTEWSIMLIVLSTETTRIKDVHQMDFFFKLLLSWHHLIHFWPFIKFWATLILFDPLQSNLTHRVHYCFWLICQLKLWQCFVGYRGSLHFVISQFVIPAMILFWAFLKKKNQKNYYYYFFFSEFFWRENFLLIFF